MKSLRGLHLYVLAAALCASPGAVQARDTRAFSLNPVASYPKAKLKSFVQAPLFDPSRRLPEVLSVPQPSRPVLVVIEPAPAIQLVGVIQGAKDVAIIKNISKTEMLHTGDRLGEWTAEVLPLGLRMRNGTRAYDYVLFNLGGKASLSR